AVWLRACNTGHGSDGLSGGLRAEAGAVQRELYGNGVQRAEADRARLRVRAGDEEARTAALVSVSERPSENEMASNATIANQRLILANQRGATTRESAWLVEARPRTTSPRSPHFGA